VHSAARLLVACGLRRDPDVQSNSRSPRSAWAHWGLWRAPRLAELAGEHVLARWPWSSAIPVVWPYLKAVSTLGLGCGRTLTCYCVVHVWSSLTRPPQLWVAIFRIGLRQRTFMWLFSTQHPLFCNLGSWALWCPCTNFREGSNSTCMVLARLPSAGAKKITCNDLSFRIWICSNEGVKIWIPELDELWSKTFRQFL